MSSVIWKQSSEYAGLGVSRFWFKWYDPNSRRPDKQIMNSNQVTQDARELAITHIPKEVRKEHNYEFVPPGNTPRSETIPETSSSYDLTPGQQLIADAGKDVFGQLLINMGVYLINPVSPSDANPIMVGPQDEIVGFMAIALGTFIKWI